MLATQSTVIRAVAQSDVPQAGGAEFFGFKTYWAEKREGCQPIISFVMKNVLSRNIGPIELHMEVIDHDKNSVFAGGSALLRATELPPGRTKEITIGGDRDITPQECLGDMHESAFSAIHFAVRLTAKVGQDPVIAEIVRDEPMKEERVPAQNQDGKS